jgi:hypothetical protein
MCVGVFFENISFVFSDNIHVAASASGQRLGCYKIGIYMEAFSVCHLVSLWRGSHPAVHLEYGKDTASSEFLMFSTLSITWE